MTALPTPQPAAAPIFESLGTGTEAASEPEEPDFIARPRASQQPDPCIRVLLVEELEQVAAHVAQMMAPDKRVRLAGTVGDGRTALERVAADSPDVIIIDVLMQGELSGLEVARRLRATGIDTPVRLHHGSGPSPHADTRPGPG